LAKRIILLSDGTGNAASKVWRSNVWRIFESLDLTGDKQVAFYDDGVGTSSFKPLAIVGGVFGWGLKRNVLDIYKFLCANYTSDDDEIFGFGFSRGAFTIRVVIGLVLDQGLVRGNTDAEFYRSAKLAYRAYRANSFHTVFQIEKPFRWARDAILRLFGIRYNQTHNRTVEKIKFLGLWDTVAAYGLPIDEMARGVSKWIFPLELPNRGFNHGIAKACHALSLDDERTTFHPVLWNEAGVPAEQLHQVWFSGVHSNVGGGYPDDSLAHISLYWIMKQAEAQGAKFKTATSPDPADNPDPDMVVFAKWLRDKDGRLYDSRNGLGGYYRYGPRKIADLCNMKFSDKPGDEVVIVRPKIHETAINRAKSGARRYAPIGIPQSYDVLTDKGLVPQAIVESPADAALRCTAQENVWNLVWRRRMIYFATVLASMCLAFYPLVRLIPPEQEFETGFSFISALVRIIGHVIPAAGQVWIDAYAADPEYLLFVAVLVGFLISMNSSLGSKIRSAMERVWRPAPAPTDSRAWVIFRRVVAAIGVAVLACASVPTTLQPSLPGQSWINSHITFWIKPVFLLALLAMLPARIVQHLRTAEPYKAFIRGLKFRWGPNFFALLFLAAAIGFGSHFAFDLLESNGFVCEPTPAIVSDLADAPNSFGISACLNASVASCALDGSISCSLGRPVYCSEGTPSCDFRPADVCATDKDPAKCFASAVCRTSATSIAGPATCAAKCEVQPQRSDVRLETTKVCNASHIWVEHGQKYVIKIIPGKDWSDDGYPVSYEGGRASNLKSGWDRIAAILLWPLKRNYSYAIFDVVVRVGDKGNDEYRLVPDPDVKDGLEMQLIPRRDGELYFYVNDLVFAWSQDYFYRANKGSAKIEAHRALQ
jgi:hypothetical protein